MAISLNDIIDRLPGVSGHFDDRHREIAEKVASILLRDRMMDEAVWLQVIRYTTHHVIWENLVLDLETDEEESAKGFGSMKVQRLAYQEKVLAQLEKDLFLSPSSRHSNLGSAQTSFIDMLVESGPTPAPSAPEDGGVTPFRPRRRAIGG